jgi:hypothetical protein
MYRAGLEVPRLDISPQEKDLGNKLAQARAATGRDDDPDLAPSGTSETVRHVRVNSLFRHGAPWSTPIAMTAEPPLL